MIETAMELEMRLETEGRYEFVRTTEEFLLYSIGNSEDSYVEN